MRHGRELLFSTHIVGSRSYSSTVRVFSDLVNDNATLAVNPLANRRGSVDLKRVDLGLAKRLVAEMTRPVPVASLRERTQQAVARNGGGGEEAVGRNPL